MSARYSPRSVPREPAALRRPARTLRAGLRLALVVLALASAVPARAEDYATKLRVGADAEVSLYSPSMFRIRVSKLEPERFPEKYEIPFVIGRLAPWPAVAYRHTTDGEAEVIETAALRIRIERTGYAWTVWSADGTRQIYPSSGPAHGMFRDGYTVFDAASALGERTRNSRYEHWFYSADTGRYVDTYLGPDLIHDEFFIYGPDYPRLFRQLSDLVGPEPVLPKKAYGFFQTQHQGCKGSEDKLLAVARKLRDHDIPADTLIIDYEWGDGCPGGDEDDARWGGLDWAPAYRTPLSPESMIAQLHAMHFDVMTIHHSAPDFPNRAADTPQRPGDWTSRVYPESVWWAKAREQLAIGVDGFWQDTRQNDVTDGVIWSELQREFAGGRRVLFMGNRNVVELDPWELNRDDTLPVTSMLASRRYPFRWTGDAQTTWSELRFQIDAITNSNGPLKGVGYVTADAYAKNWRHQARWNQFLSFAPIARSHTMKPWDAQLDVRSLQQIMRFQADKLADRQELATKLDPEAVNAWAARNAPGARTAEHSVRRYLKLRYRLLPYIYSMAHVDYLTGMPIARPMVVACADDPHCRSGRWPVQYMFGDAFLVAPVYADLSSMEVYLPAGSDWIDYYSHEVYRGGTQLDFDTRDAEKLPLFVRAGSIIPMRAEANWIEPGRVDSPLYLDVYPDAREHAFTLYEDDGITTEYQAGAVATTEFTSLRRGDGSIELALGPTTGGYRGMPAGRTLEITVNLVGRRPLAVARDGAELVRVDRLAPLRRRETGWLYDGKHKTVVIRVAAATGSRTTLVVTPGG